MDSSAGGLSLLEVNAGCAVYDGNVHRYRLAGRTVRIRCQGAPNLTLMLSDVGKDTWLYQSPDGDILELGTLQEVTVSEAKRRARTLGRSHFAPPPIVSNDAASPRDSKVQKRSRQRRARENTLEISDATVRGLRPCDHARRIRCRGLEQLILVVPPGEPGYWLLDLPDHAHAPTIRLGSLKELKPSGAKGLARKLIREPKRSLDDGPTLRKYCKAYWTVQKPKLQPSTRLSYASRMRRLIEAFGDQPLTWITHRSVKLWHAEYSKRSPGGADEAKALLRSIFNHARHMGVIDPGHPNPCGGIHRNRPGIGNRSLSSDELASLGRVLVVEKENPRYRDHVRRVQFTLFTGARPGEARTLVWSSVVEVDGCLSHLQLPTSKTGPRRIELNRYAMEILMEQPNLGKPLPAFPSYRDGRICTQQVASQAWRHFADTAGLAKESRQYWLRHTFGSNAILDGGTLLETSRLLGHASTDTTKRYVHVPPKATIAAGERIGERIADWLGVADWVRDLKSRRPDSR